MPDWFDLGWTPIAPDGEVYKTFEWAIEQHASVLNAKSTAVPASYVDAVQELLRRNGYRFVVESFNHASQVASGGPMTFTTRWANTGVAPSYIRRTVAFRLRGAGNEALLESQADIRAWLPGAVDVLDTFTVPSSLPAGTYAIEVAILDRAGTDPATDPLPPLRLAMEGRGSDGWYALSSIEVE